jgi:large subunit ribosomal protein L4
VGGGIAFGPKPRHYTVKVNRKARRRALGAALSLHAERGSLAVVDPGDFAEPSTKRAAELIERSHTAPTLVVLAREGEEACARSFRNLAGVTVVAVDDVGVAEIVWARRLVLSPAAIAKLSEAAGAGPAPGEEG